MSRFYDRIVSQVRTLTPYQPGKPIDELQRELGLARISKLASNENPLGCSPKVVAAIEQALPNLARYPDGNAYYFKQKLAAHLGVQPGQILPGNGSNEVLELVVRTFAGPGDEVIYDQYAFAVYPLSTRAAGATGVAVPAKDYAHDLSAMADAITARTKVIFLANPNNPTGTLFDTATFEQFMQRVPEQVIVVLDEAYYEYVQVADYPDGLDYLSRYPNLLVSRTFSKVYGLAGVRLGYLVGDAEIIDYLNRVREPFNVNTLAQVAGMAALDDKDFVAESVELNRDNMAWFTAALSTLKLAYIPSSGNFVTVHTGADTARINQSLLQQGVIVRPLTGYGMAEWLRISIGTRDELEHCVDALQEACRV
ncbi:MAG TPA: histidinol-phosphate transaminase [Piscirickettsiaceae bacterium]|nr:histidinol-phosphate transaminase [Piscirickettsiaceae bacterium]